MPTGPESSEAGQLPLAVVIDANTWRSELMLRTPMGAAVLHAIRQMDGRLGLPRVIERELEKHAVRAGTEAVDRVRHGLSALQRLTGAAPEVELPDESLVRQAVSDRLVELEALIERVPFTLEHAVSALDRVDSGEPPNAPKNQQFKDSAIWEAVLELGGRFRVVLVTADKGFYSHGDPEQGLAPNLLGECSAASISIAVLPTLSATAEHLRESVPALDYDRFEKAITAAIWDYVDDACQEAGFQVADLSLSNIQPYATERLDILAIAFEFEFAITDIALKNQAERQYATAVVLGSCAYDLREHFVTDLRLENIALHWTDAEGKSAATSRVYLSSADVVGRRTIPLRIRVPLP